MPKIKHLTRQMSLVGLSVLCTAYASHAIDDARKSQVEKLILHYAEATACGFWDNQGATEIVELVDGGKTATSTYFAFPAWSSECEGRPAIVPLVIRVGDEFGRDYRAMVDVFASQELEFRMVDTESYAFSGLESVEVLSSDRIRIKGANYGPNDPMANPSEPFEAIFQWESGGLWAEVPVASSH